MKRILFVNGSYNETPLIDAAHRMGYYVITSGNDPTGEGHKYANEYIPCDYSDKEAIYEIAKTAKVDAICACGNDFGALSASYACEKLGLPGHDLYETSRYFHEKDCFKKMVRELGLTSPESFSFTHINQAMNYADSTSFPKIIKPVDLSGGKGVYVVNNAIEAKKAIADAFRISKVGRIVIEEYVVGQQQGFTAYLKNQKVVFDYSTNDYAYLNPFLVWMAIGSPADGYDKYREKVIADIEKMAKQKQMADGFLTIQLILKDGVPYYMETMRRCLGNYHYLCMGRDLQIDFYELFIATETGDDCTPFLERINPVKQKSGFIVVFAKQNGVVDRIEIDEWFQSKVFNVKMFKGPGCVIDDYLHDKLGIMMFSMSEDDVQRFLDNKRELVRVYMKDKS